MEAGSTVKLAPSVLKLDWQEVQTRIQRFIKDYAAKSHADGIVIGLSGGVDSCMIAALSALAIGGKRVTGLMLPEKEASTSLDTQHAKLLAKKFGLRTKEVDITGTLEAIYKSIPAFDTKDRMANANVKARTRMIYVYYEANKQNLIVCGSSDKSETMMGYFTKWGDVAADIHPLMDLYKTQVRHLARHLGLPEEIVSKPSTPALWPGQLAEDELGMKYEQLDLVLYGLERFMTTSEVSEQLDIPQATVEAVKRRWLSAEHKRRMLLVPKLEYRTIGTDFRLVRNP
jgi:NAD+ synthase